MVKVCLYISLHRDQVVSLGFVGWVLVLLERFLLGGIL